MVTVAGGDGKFQPTRKVSFDSLSAGLYQAPLNVPNKHHLDALGI